MAIEWEEGRTARIAHALAEHPASSHQCRRAAVAVVAVAREQDSAARIAKLLPSEGKYVLPRQSVGEPWEFHFTTAALAHFVDAFTGASGTEAERYLDAHWQYPDAIDIVDLEEGTP